MNVWLSKKWKKNVTVENLRRGGLRCYFDSDCSYEVRESWSRFAKWLRNNFQFPAPVSIFFKANKSIEAADGDCVSALFVEPYPGNPYPRIYIAVGDYDECKQEVGRDNALGGILRSAAHELTHYFQWINGIQLTDRGIEMQARYYADLILGWYADTCEHP